MVIVGLQTYHFNSYNLIIFIVMLYVFTYKLTEQKGYLKAVKEKTVTICNLLF